MKPDGGDNSVRRPSSDAWAWFSCGWRLFAQKPLLHIGFALLLFALGLVFALIPVIGNLVFSIISPVLMGSWMRVFREQQLERDVSVEDIFAVFGDAERRGPLLKLGLYILVAQLAIALIGLGMMGGAMALGGGDLNGAVSATGFGFAGLAGLLVVLVIATVMMMALFFAIPRILFDGIPTNDALVQSYVACRRNLGVLTVFGLIYLVLALLAVLPMGLGLVLLVPVTVAASYCAYQAVFSAT